MNKRHKQYIYIYIYISPFKSIFFVVVVVEKVYLRF